MVVDLYEPGGPSAIAELHDSATRQVSEANFAFRNPGLVTTVGATGGTRENELILWNYLVGRAQLRPPHLEALRRTAPRWRRELQRDRLVQIKIVGSASSATGDPARNERVARARAETVRRLLVSLHGIPSSRITVGSVGSRVAIADETDPDNVLNMARDRRVEIVLFTPARLVTSIPGVRVRSFRADTNLDRASNSIVVDLAVRGNLYSERMGGILAHGGAVWSGPPDSTIGFIQLVTSDVRTGIYQGVSRRLILDFARCTRPFLPCRDFEDAADRLSVAGLPGTGRFSQARVRFRDAPGTALPVRVVDPIVGPATLRQSVWSMTFVLLFGVRRAERFLPLQYTEWRTVSVRRFPGLQPVRGPVALRLRGGRGAPPGLPFAPAMAGATCRLRTRSIDRDRRRTPDDECPEVTRGRPCPPLVCSAHATRL